MARSFANSSGFPPRLKTATSTHMRQGLVASQDMTHIFSPTLLADFKVSFSRFLDSFPNGDLARTVTPGPSGSTCRRSRRPPACLLPQFKLAAAYYPQVVGNAVGNDIYNSFYFDNDWTKTVANHTIHFGGEVGEIAVCKSRLGGKPEWRLQLRQPVHAIQSAATQHVVRSERWLHRRLTCCSDIPMAET